MIQEENNDIKFKDDKEIKKEDYNKSKLKEEIKEKECLNQIQNLKTKKKIIL